MNFAPSKGELNAAAVAAEYAANATTIEQEMQAMTQLMQHQNALQVGLAATRMAQFSNPAPGHERLPLLDEGHEFGRVVARVPEDLYYSLYYQKDFGPDGFHSDEGIRDLNKHFPVCRTKTVSGKTVVGWTPDKTRARRSGNVNFGRGTISFAK